MSEFLFWPYKEGIGCLSLLYGSLVSQKGYIALKDGGNTIHLCILKMIYNLEIICFYILMLKVKILHQDIIIPVFFLFFKGQTMLP